MHWIAIVGLLAVTTAGADSFKFNSPTFGGNPMAGSHLMLQANALRPDAPKPPKVDNTKTELERFTEQLQRRALSSITSAITRDIYGAEGGTEGQYIFDDFELTYTRENGIVEILVDDGVQEVVIELPDLAN